MPAGSNHEFAEQCADYYLKAADKAAAKRRLDAHIDASIKNPKQRTTVRALMAQYVDSKRPAKKAAAKPRAEPAAAAAAAAYSESEDEASDEDFEDDGDYSDEDDEDDVDEFAGGDVVVEGDDEVFDLDAFASKGGFKQDEALEAFTEWKRERDTRRKPLSFMSIKAPGEEDPDDIPDDVFARARREKDLQLIKRDQQRLVEIEAELKESDLTKTEVKRLTQIKDRTVRSIAERKALLR